MFQIKFNGITFLSNYKFVNNLEKLLVIHGLGCEANDYKFLFKLKINKFHILIPEIPGHNNTNPRLSIDPVLEFSRNIYLFLKKNKIKKFIIFSHSMGSIVSILLLAKFLKTKTLNKFINYEGNLLSSDASMVTRKTVSYKKKVFIEKSFKQLIQKCEKSSSESIRSWSKSLKKIKAESFYNYSISVVKWSDKNILLSYYKFFFKRSIYLFGEYTENPHLTNFLLANKKKAIEKGDHFSCTSNSYKFNRLLLNYIYRKNIQ